MSRWEQIENRVYQSMGKSVGRNRENCGWDKGTAQPMLCGREEMKYLATPDPARFYRPAADRKLARMAVQCALGLLPQRRIGIDSIRDIDFGRARPNIKTPIL